MEFLHVFISLFLNISMTSSELSVVAQGFLETVLTLGIPLSVGSAHTLSSQPPLTLLGSPDTLVRRLFFFCFILLFSNQWGFPYIPRPNSNLHNFNSQYYIEKACSKILVLTFDYTLISLRESLVCPYMSLSCCSGLVILRRLLSYGSSNLDSTIHYSRSSKWALKGKWS